MSEEKGFYSPMDFERDFDEWQRQHPNGQTAQEVQESTKAAFLEWLSTNPPSEAVIEYVKELQRVAALNIGATDGSNKVIQGLELLSEDAQAEIRRLQEANEYLYNFALETAIGSFQTHDSGQNVINDSPVLKNMLRGSKPAEIILGTNAETGEAAIFTLLSGYITPYEKEIIECVSKFKLDGQLTDKGKIWFTVGQLYRAMRHGAGTQSPTTDQRAAIMETLTELSKPERKLTFKLNDYLRTWGGFETNGGRVRLIGFDELFGKIRGQEDILIILDDTPVICAVAENLHMWEPIPQAVKAIKQDRYTLEYMGDGKLIKRSFATNEARRKYCQSNGITEADIEAHGVQSKAWALSENRIALRSVILTFVYGYIRARAAGAPHSDQLNYNDIFERCGIIETRAARQRAKADIAVILEHLSNTVDELKARRACGLKTWEEYTNKGAAKPDGIRLFIGTPKAQIEGAAK